MSKTIEESMPDEPVNELDALLAAKPKSASTMLISKGPATLTEALAEAEAGPKKPSPAKSRAKSSGVEISQAQRDIPHQKKLSDMIAAHDAKSRQRRAENQARRMGNIPRTGQR